MCALRIKCHLCTRWTRSWPARRCPGSSGSAAAAATGGLPWYGWPNGSRTWMTPRPAAWSCCPGRRLRKSRTTAWTWGCAGRRSTGWPRWRRSVTAMDIAGRADIALISIPAGAELAGLVQAIAREISGGAQRALGRAEEGLNAVLHAEAAGAGFDELRAAVSEALGTSVEFRPRGPGHHAQDAGA